MEIFVIAIVIAIGHRFQADKVTRVTKTLVEISQQVGDTQFGIVIAVEFVNDDMHGDAVGFGRGQKTVDERGAGFGVVDGDEEQTLVDIGSKDVTLLAEVGGLADDVVAAVLDVGDPSFGGIGL